MKLKQWVIRTALKFNLFTRKPKVEDYRFMTKEQAVKKIVNTVIESKEYQRLVQIIKEHK